MTMDHRGSKLHENSGKMSNFRKISSSKLEGKGPEKISKKSHSLSIKGEKLVPIVDRDDGKNSAKGNMKKSVSFSTLNKMEKIPSRVELLEMCDKETIWFEKEDITRFAQEELSRRSSLGCDSTKALDSSVPDDDIDNLSDDMSGLSF
eukprot:CAMPEP_0178920168 /NCGR_PEP_ID=MMETSP0786-20121207/14854_1 /TAXON_ID=186022 /ORGANISM="Thalassionema frauenfeldii, Strain CCMP 1798" /LENGTH=147 /DNA_ID=CAMNT_0020594203 /DNA_START=151 /DNA_END=594 /DNA_ORIENTATION=-